MPAEYSPKQIEPKWQAYWEEHKTFRTPNPGEAGFDPAKPKFYVLDMFPYPSGTGLHVGHPEGYTATDIIARYRRMKGYNVLHPMGWDAFGLPAEQHAVETGQHPAITTERNINTFRRQMKALGFSYDWDRELATTDPKYYRWTQWIFLQLFGSWYDDTAQKARPIRELEIPPETRAKGEGAAREFVDSHRLAYLAEVPVNWCPALGTVLANEEVTNEGRSERGNHPVFRRPMRQWMLRITKYADRLERDLEALDWPESIKLMQRNWIGRSEGAVVAFRVAADQSRDRKGAVSADQSRERKGVVSADQSRDRMEGIPSNDNLIEVFTTRPDTLFGATYMVLAPEHPLVERITTDAQRQAVRAYCAAALQRSDMARTAEAKEKSGVFTGSYAINPVNDEAIPIWVADYVLMGYGTGAIMAVPAHDERDFEFAKQFDLPIRAVVRPPESWVEEQIVANRIDVEHARRRGREQAAEILMRSATSAATMMSATYRDTRPLIDGDSSWIDQVAMPAHAEDPGLFVDAYTGDGLAINSGRFDGLPTAEFKRMITTWLAGRGLGHADVNYKLRDWLFSRQRYWGEPFPILHGPDGELVALQDAELPLALPEIENFAPAAMHDDSAAEPEPPLGRAKEWATVRRGGKTYRRELNTMPQWAGSCWYYLRFIDPKNDARLCGEQAERYWMISLKKDGAPHADGIDLYLGGAEHAVLHLLYARFWHKLLFDLGYVSTPEPFGKLFNQGMIRAFAYRDRRGIPVGYDEIDFREDGAYRRSDAEKLAGAVEKMSKALKNVVNPDEVVGECGADSLRLYEMFMGPLDASKPWNPRDVPGVFRFLQRCWRLIAGEREGRGLSEMVVDAGKDSDGRGREEKGSLEPSAAGAPLDGLERLLHKTIKKVGEDIGRMAFNTAIAAMMEFVNEAYRAKGILKSQAERFVLILSPFAPHLGEELWQRLRGPAWRVSLADEPWPEFDPTLVVDDQIEVPIQVNGKLVARVTVPPDATEDAVRSAALAHPKVEERLHGKSVAKTIYVPARLLNLVVR